MKILWMLSDIRTPFLDKFFQFITYFGQELIVIVVICALYWCIDKRFAYLMGFTYFTAGLCVQSLKITFRIPRPWVLDPDFKPVKSAVSKATGYSFPSGHTQGGTSLFALLAFRAEKRQVKVLCVLAFLLIGFSRIYLGVHTPKDVLAAMGISLCFTWLVWHFQNFLLDDDRYIRRIAITLTVISLAVCVYALLLYRGQVITADYAADCCKAGGAGLGFAAGWFLERTRFHFNMETRTAAGQWLKLIVGLLITVLIKSGLKLLIGTSIPADVARYFLLVFWVLIIYPYCFTKLTKSSLQ